MHERMCILVVTLFLDSVVIIGCTDDNLGSESKCTLSRVYVPPRIEYDGQGHVL